jgi:Icc-related predicted phosphoesterase
VRFLYVTDLHGDSEKYERALEEARAERVAAVVNGGDLLPKGAGRRGQESFLLEFLDAHFAAYDEAGIAHLACLGNDDLRIYDGEFDRICASHESTVNLAQRRHALDGVEFVGMNWVVDYPFRLKDRCRMDHRGYEFQAQFGSGLLSGRDGFTELPDWFDYARALPTIEDELERLVRPSEMSRAVYVVHMPPAELGLDECGHGESVGSESVYRFIEREQPLMTLHGHIHESPDTSSLWSTTLGETVCVQPGQSEMGGPLSLVLIDTDEMSFERRIV